MRTTLVIDIRYQLQESDIVVDFAEMHYGKGEENPLDFVRFYSKLEPNRTFQFHFALNV